MEKTTRTGDDGLITGDDAVYKRQGAVTVYIDGKVVNTIVKGDKGDLVVFDKRGIDMFPENANLEVQIALKIGSLVKHIKVQGIIHKVVVTRWA